VLVTAYERASRAYSVRSDAVASSRAMRGPLRIGGRLVFALAIFALLATAILTRPSKTLTQFDQPLYFTVASDILHHGVFSNGWFGDRERTNARPAPGMFFGPLYPWMIVAVAKADPRFASAVDCGADMYRGKWPYLSCEIYIWPMLVIHALLLTAGALAIAQAAKLLLGNEPSFYVTGVLVTGTLTAEADQFSFVMTEATTFSLYNLSMLAMVLGWTMLKRPYFVLAGLGFGVLCLARFSFLVAVLIMPLLIAINSRFIVRPQRGWGTTSMLAFTMAFLAVVLPWVARNAISVRKFGLTEEYGSLTLVERFAYDQMTAREFALAFPYCLPVIGSDIVSYAFGPPAMARFNYENDGSFYDIGSSHRVRLVAEYKRVDPIIGWLTVEEMKENWWRYILVSIPLAWCGMWVGGWLGFALVPFFAGTCFAAWRLSRPRLLLYAAPAVVMLGLHAALASFYTRYNFALIGPFSVSAAWVIASVGVRVRNFEFPLAAPWQRVRALQQHGRDPDAWRICSPPHKGEHVQRHHLCT
jgi:hypothetical protein